MRYADGPAAECEIRIAAAAPRVWELVSDIGLPARLSPELHRVEWLGGATAPAPGARFAGHNRHPKIGEWRTVSQIMTVTAEREFGWAVLDTGGRFGAPVEDPAQPLATWCFVLEPAPGHVLVRHSVRIGPGASGLSVVIARMPDREEQLIEARLAELRAGMEATLKGIKALAEG
ncbi:SRPBCC family protein [Streptomyces purpurogeneiscleroticus]|uniref:SRPBCC family protein n=1 Tax=Streptomyces purpurogeneiscleroticus TaxID=68259 RepID=UPI001CBD0A67|nr:SRPBCC family protein [Streptomyces purpurogeneiscleroticus]MBZ4020343.1 polyketide cyclase [Streptomyces purpurogeneiscleroticus]